MSALVIDTSSWISYFAGKENRVIDEALEEGRGYLTPIVAAELTSGTLSKRERIALADLLSDIPLCSTDLNHWFNVGELRATLRKSGLSVSTPDAHVAQCTMELRGRLLTEDRVFTSIAKLTRLKLA